MKHILKKISFWNLFAGLIIGFGAGVWFINLLIPNANQLIKMYRLDYKSINEDRAARSTGSPIEASFEFNK